MSSKTQMRHMRSADVRSIYQDILKTRGTNKSMITRKAIVDFIFDSPAPRFYIGPKEAERYVLGYYHCNEQGTKVSKLDMIQDLVQNYERLRRRHPHTPQNSIWVMVVNSPAKSFYMTKGNIYRTLYYHQVYRNDRNKNRNYPTGSDLD